MESTRRELLTGALAAAATRASQNDDRADLAWLSLAEAAALVRKRKLSPVELTQNALARIEKFDKPLNCFITVMADQALAQARELEAEQVKGRFRGPLHGIPIGLKDLYDTAGVRTTAASAHFTDRVPTEDADVVKSLRASGAIFLGKLNMDEFAFNFTSETSHFGPVHNPWKRDFSPGGSSGASGAAVAAGLCYGALGSDTGGSIRLPAALCGIAGFKPAYGQLSTRGVLPLAWSLDHPGPMCRRVGDLRLMLEGMGFRLRPSGRPLRSVRLGIPRAVYFDTLHPEAADAVSKAVDTLARLTSGAGDVDLPRLAVDPVISPLPRDYGAVIQAEAYAYHEERIRTQSARFHPRTRANIEGGAKVTAAAYIRARQEMDRAREASGELFSKAGLLVMPTAPGPAFRLGSEPPLVWLRNTAPWNFYGLPAVSVPCGFSRDGLPIGMQIVGPRDADDLVLAAAEAYEQETDWRRRHPAL